MNDKPGIGGESFKIQLDKGWITTDMETIIIHLRQMIWGTQDIIDRMVNQYNKSTDNE